MNPFCARHAERGTIDSSVTGHALLHRAIARAAAVTQVRLRPAFRCC